MLRILICIFACTLGYAFASVEDHLKIASNKTIVSKMRNIDFIYMINLDARPEKYAHAVSQLAPYGIYPYRFSAVNGWELSMDDINDVGVKYENWMRHDLMGTCYLADDNWQPHHEIMHIEGRNYFCHCMARGTIGIALSHLSILKDAYDSGYETIWVLEDDIEVIKDPHQIADLIDKLDEIVGKDRWDFLFTDFDTNGSNEQYVPCSAYALRPDFIPADPHKCLEKYDICKEFRKVGARYGAYSMIVRRSGMKKMLDFMKDGIFLPYDMEYTLPNDICLYTVREDIVSTQPRAISDNGAPNYKQNLIKN